MKRANVDHRGRSNDDCPLIIKLQEEIKRLKNEISHLKRADLGRCPR